MGSRAELNLVQSGIERRKPMDYLAGIDLGSTSLKCVIYDLAGNIVTSATRPTQRFNPYPDHPEWTVWQPEQIWGDTAAAMKEAVSRLINPRYIRAVAVTGMGMDGLPVDERGDWFIPLSAGMIHAQRSSCAGGRKISARNEPFALAATPSGASALPYDSCGWPNTNPRSSPAPTSGC
jgi:sugar (pentulose or hexulose) kinase